MLNIIIEKLLFFLQRANRANCAGVVLTRVGSDVGGEEYLNTYFKRFLCRDDSIRCAFVFFMKSKSCRPSY